MKVSDEELRRLFPPATARPRGSADACPRPEALVEAAEGRLTPAERESLADHLSACSDCAAEYRVLADVRTWTGTVARAADARAQGALPSATARGQRPGRTWQASWPHALAASLAAVALALGAWAGSIRREHERLSAWARAGDAARAAAADRARAAEAELARLRSSAQDAEGPLLNVAIVDLFPPGPERGGRGSTSALVEVPAGVGQVTFILNPKRPPAPGRYRLTLLDAVGRVLWQGEGLRATPESNFTFAVPARFLSSGDYRISVSPLREGSRGGVEEYAVRVRVP